MNKIVFLKRKKRKSIEKHIHTSTFDSSSIGDMAFLLLIFFIVTGSFLVRQGIFFAMPQKNTGSVHVSENRIIEIEPAENDFYFEGKLTEREDLKNMIIERKAKQDDLIVKIVMKSDIKYKRMIDALSIVRETKIGKVSIKTVTEE